MPILKKSKSAAKLPAKKDGPAQSLATWLFGAPIKFAIVAGGLFIALIFAISLLAPTPVPGQEFVVPLYLRIIFIGLLLLIPAFSIYMLVIRWTPSGNLDRRSFLGLSVTTTIISTTLILLACFAAWYFKSSIFALMWFMQLTASPTLMLTLLVLALFIVLYVLGIYMSAKYVAQYWRVRAMGIPRWKFLCAFPFGWSLLAYPAIFLPEEKKNENILPIKAKWLSWLTDWSFAKTSNAILLIIVLPLAATSLLLPDMAIMSVGVTLIPIVIFFGLWIWLGKKKMNDAMPKWFSSMTIILNAIAIIAYVCMLMLAKPTTQPNPIMIEDIQITETIE